MTSAWAVALLNRRLTLDKTKAQVLALAGILQSAYLVDQVAQTGSAPAESVNPSINSLFNFDPESPEAIYGGIHGVKLGIKLLNDILGGGKTSAYRATIRYALGIQYLQKKLSSKPELLEVISSRLQHTAIKADHFSNDSASIAASVAAIYQDTVSNFKFRIQVSGSIQQLENPKNAEMIRALLMAGIRSSVMWRQMGGKRWQLFLSRQRLLNCCRDLLQEL